MRLRPSICLLALCISAAAAAQGPPAPSPNLPQGPVGGGLPGPAGRPGGPPQAPPALPPLTPAAIERATTILAESRKAMGGDKLAAVKTVLATGRTNRVRGNNLVPIEFEIAMELPDKYVRKDEVPAEESEPTSTGFSGADIIQLPLPPPPGARPGGPAPPAPNPQQVETQRRARLTTIKQDYVRLALGMFASSTPAYPLTFGWAAQA